MFSFICKFDIFMKFIQNIIDVHDVFDAVALDIFAPIIWKKGTLMTLIGVLIWYVPIVIFCRNNYTV